MHVAYSFLRSASSAKDDDPNAAPLNGAENESSSVSSVLTSISRRAPQIRWKVDTQRSQAPGAAKGKCGDGLALTTLNDMYNVD